MIDKWMKALQQRKVLGTDAKQVKEPRIPVATEECHGLTKGVAQCFWSLPVPGSPGKCTFWFCRSRWDPRLCITHELPMMWWTAPRQVCRSQKRRVLRMSSRKPGSQLECHWTILLQPTIAVYLPWKRECQWRLPTCGGGQFFVEYGGTILCTVGCLASSLNCTHQLDAGNTLQLWQPRMSPDIAKCPLGQGISPSGAIQWLEGWLSEHPLCRLNLSLLEPWGKTAFRMYHAFHCLLIEMLRECLLLIW